jgi:hypothetical protein
MLFELKAAVKQALLIRRDSFFVLMPSVGLHDGFGGLAVEDESRAGCFRFYGSWSNGKREHESKAPAASGSARSDATEKRALSLPPPPPPSCVAAMCVVCGHDDEGTTVSKAKGWLWLRGSADH